MLVTDDTFEESVAPYLRGGTIMVDVETNGLQAWNGNRIIGIAHATEDGKVAHYFPYRHVTPFSAEGYNLPQRRLKQHIKLLEKARKQPGHREIGHNYKFDMQFLMVDGATLPHTIGDTILDANLVNENEESFKLENLAVKYVDPDADKAEEGLLDELAAIGHKDSKSNPAKQYMWKLPAHLVYLYACQDVRTTANLREYYKPKLDFWKVGELAEEVYEYSLTLTELEARGVMIDVERVHSLRNQAVEEKERVLWRMRKDTGEEKLNPGSYVQMQRVLDVPSTASEYIEMLIRGERMEPEKLALARLLQEYRGWDKVVGSYYDPYLRTVTDGGIIHPNYRLGHVVTSRLSMAKPSPNLMAIPVADDDPAMSHVKEVFIARPGYVLIEFDLSQAELRVIAHYAKETTLRKWLEDGRDIHTETMLLLRQYGINMVRDHAKRINFGVAYGLGKKGFSEKTGLSMSDAALIMNMYHKLFPGYRVLMDTAEEHARTYGSVRLWTGRPQRFNTRRTDPHKAMSHLIQGGVAELIRVAMTKLREPLRKWGASQLLQVHDSIMVEVPDDDETICEVFTLVRSVMEVSPFDVSLRADAKIGYRWADSKKVNNMEELKTWLSLRS